MSVILIAAAKTEVRRDIWRYILVVEMAEITYELEMRSKGKEMFK